MPALSCTSTRGADVTDVAIIEIDDDRVAVLEVGIQGPRGRDGAATLPPGAPGQLLGYGPDGEPAAVDTPHPPLSSQQW